MTSNDCEKLIKFAHRIRYNALATGSGSSQTHQILEDAWQIILELQKEKSQALAQEEATEPQRKESPPMKPRKQIVRLDVAYTTEIEVPYDANEDDIDDAIKTMRETRCKPKCEGWTEISGSAKLSNKNNIFANKHQW